MQTVLRLTLTLIGQLPLPLLHGLGWLLGQLLWLLPNKLKSITVRHLEMCFPERSPAERARIAHTSLIESAKAVCEAPAIWFGSDRRLRRLIDDEPARQAFRDAVAGGKGAVMLTPHMGAWEITGLFATQIGKITLLYKPQKGVSDAVILQGRSRWPDASLAPTTGSGVKSLIGALRRGEMVGILPDHDPPEDSGTRFAPLFGVPANTMDLVSKLAGRTGAPVWFFLAERLSWGRGFRYHLVPAPAGIADAELGPRALNEGLETCIRMLPGQYWWSYKRFRRRPPGQPDPYENL